MKKLILNLKPFNKEQSLYIYENGECIDNIIIENFNIIKEIVNKNNQCDEIILDGPQLCNRIKKNLIKEGINENKIKII